MKKGVIFDLDGTLWDSAQGVADSWTEAIKDLDDVDKVISREDIMSIMGKTMEAIGLVFFSEYSKERRLEIMEYCCEKENAYLLENPGKLYDGVEETFQKLQQAGYHLYIVSNCQQGYIETFLQGLHLESYMDDIECYGNNGLEKGENIKGLVARNELEECVYLGDTQGDYDACKVANVPFIHAAYGFGTVNGDVPKITSIRELPEVL